MAVGEPSDPTWTYPLSDRQIDDLRMLSAEFGGWAMWSESGPRYVALDEWQPIYERWKQGRYH